MALPDRLTASVLVLAGALSACAGPSRSPDEPPIPFRVFEAADANKDGKLDREEALTIPDLAEGVRGSVVMNFETLFQRLDADHSGLLSWNELRAARFPIYPLPRIQGSPRIE